MRMHDARQGFGLRLAATLVLTTTVVGAAQYVLSGRALTSRVLAHDLDGHRADAQVLRSLYDARAEDPMAEVGSLLGHVASRPGVLGALLLGPDGRLVRQGVVHVAGPDAAPHGGAPAHGDAAMPMQAPAHGDAPMPMDAPALGDAATPMDAPAAMPMDAPTDAAAPMPMPAPMDMSIPTTTDPLPGVDGDVIASVIARGEARSTRVEHEQRVVHAVPVEIGGERHALLIARSDAPLEAQVASVRRVLLLTLALGTFLALPLFFLIGGRGLAARHRKAVDAATRDGLTGLGNHRHFHEQLAATVAENAQSRAPLCLALVDLDDFKHVNDSEGHRRGDEVLASIARVLLAAAPHGAFRVGGDEFALVLPGRLEEANTLAERVRHQVQALGLGVTTSIGIAPLVPGSAAQPLWDAADAALYAAKRGGRNRVVIDGSTAVFANI